MTAPRTLPKLNSIFFKVAGIIVVTVGLVIGTISFVSMTLTSGMTQQIVAEQAFSNSKLLGELISGALKFGKADQITEAFALTARDSNGQLIGAAAVRSDGEMIATYGDIGSSAGGLKELASKALESQERVVSADLLTIALPLRFGTSDAVVGVFISRWTPERMLASAQRAQEVALLWAGAVFLASVTLALILCGRLIVTPLRKFRAAIQALGEKRYDTEIPGTHRGDEIGDIGKTLHTLSDQLAAGEGIQRDASFKGAAFMGCSAALMVVDDGRIIRYLNPRMTALLTGHRDLIARSLPGFDPATLVGKPIDTCSFGGANFRELLRGTVAGDAQTILRLGDVHLSLATSAVLDDAGHALGHVLEWADVTKDILNRATLSSIEANQLKAEFAPDGDLMTANTSFANALSASAEALKGRGLRDIVVPDGSNADIATRLLEGARQGKGFAGKMRLSRPDGSLAIVDGSLTSICDHDGKPIRLLLLGNDVTQAEAELDSARKARDEAEKQQSHVVEALRVGLERLSQGDLTATIQNPFSGSYEQLRSDYNGALTTLATAMSGIARSAESIHNEARDISSTADGLSRRTETNSATLEETAAALDTLTTSVRAAASGADQADTAVSAAKTNAENSGKVVLETVSAMDQIAGSSERITSIIKVIDDIAFQTNLLALNAGVEAARAGDAGRGFAVVASEVRALAQRSSNAAREINDLIAKSATQVKTGVELVGRTGQALHQIVDSVSEISTLVSDIASSARQQSSSLAEINNSVSQLDQSTQQNAARLEETTAASETLRQNALTLVDAVSRFRVVEEARETDGVIRVQAKSNTPIDPAPSEGRKVSAVIAKSHPAIAKAAAQWEDF